MKLKIIGAAGTVTGSKYLIETSKAQVLVDCGLFQGLKDLRLMNWREPAFDPKKIDAVILTHAHLDHSGYIPRLVKLGFEGRIFVTHATLKVCEILLPDAGSLMEEEARYANEKGFSKHHPAEALYTEADAIRALSRFEPVNFHQSVAVAGDLEFQYFRAGHILGAASVRATCGPNSAIFSGDIGRFDDSILYTPEPIPSAEVVVIESTYGNRLHGSIDPLAEMEQFVVSTLTRGGTVLIPSFAVGRAQKLLHLLYRLKTAGKLGGYRVYVDSPMARDVTELYESCSSEHRLTKEQAREIFSIATYINSQDQSRALSKNTEPKVIVSASGMATGGRVLHHMRSFGRSSKNLILFTGYQAAGTRGDRLLNQGEKSVKIHGEMIEIKAEVACLQGLSAHADQRELLKWAKQIEGVPPKRCLITHGEYDSSQELSSALRRELGWNCIIPHMGDEFTLG
ncbi:MAG: MBL fold metallo-hydrolase [Bdellovibrionales bacterium CG10_big_fil_rev_8_21_14_0_10_45_34]|nr:MAG: MBL fold metallo-hydrolase [Bdellovibrionales bacterium CG10_big_fil_rev_8_21_14_0_10_45_34]